MSLPSITSTSSTNSLSNSILSVINDTNKSTFSKKPPTTDFPKLLLSQTWQRPRAFELLKDNVKKVLSELKTGKYNSNTVQQIDLSCFQILLEISSLNSHMNDIFKIDGMLEIIVQTLLIIKHQQSINSRTKMNTETYSTHLQYIRTCCLYFIVNHTKSNAIADTISQLLLNGAIQLLTDISLSCINTEHSNDNQTQKTSVLSRWCYLAKDENQKTVLDLQQIATLAVVKICQYSASFDTQFHRFQCIDETGVFETVLSSKYHTDQEIIETLLLYSLEDHIRFKNRGCWKNLPGKLALRRLNIVISLGKDKTERKAKQLEHYKKTKELVSCKIPIMLVPRLEAIHLVSNVELFGLESIPLPTTPRSVPTPSLSPDQLTYLSWQMIANMSNLSKNEMLKKSKLGKTFASAEYCKAGADSVLFTGDEMDTSLEKDKQKEHILSTKRILKVAETEYNLYKSVALANQHGFTSSNINNIIALEHAEIVARNVVQLEIAKLNVIEIDLNILLKPIHERKRKNSDSIDAHVKLLHRKAIHLEREMRANLSFDNNAAAAAAAVAAVASAQEKIEGNKSESQTSKNDDFKTNGLGRRNRGSRRRNRGKPLILSATPEQKRRKEELAALKLDITEAEKKAKILHTSKLIDICNEDEKTSFLFLNHAVKTIKCNIACALAALDVAMHKLSVERIVKDMKENSNELNANEHNWDRLIEAMEHLRQAKVQNGVSLCALSTRIKKTKHELLNSSSSSRNTDDRKLISEWNNSHDFPLSATTADLQALEDNFSTLTNIGVIHPRLLHLRELYVSGILEPRIKLGKLYQSLALAKANLHMIPHHLNDTSLYRQHIRLVDFYRWRCANNNLHSSTNIHGHHLVENALNNSHATPNHLMHKAGKSAVNVLTMYYGEIVQSEIAFSKSNDLLLASEAKEGLIGDNSFYCNMLSMHGNDEKNEKENIEKNNNSPVSWLNYCDSKFNPSISICKRSSKIMAKVIEFAKSAKSCADLAEVQVHKVIDMIQSIDKCGILTPTMRISIEREETIFNATRKKLHYANLMLAEHYSMLNSIIIAEKAKYVATNEKLNINIRKSASLAQSRAENYAILSNKIVGSTTGNLSEKEMKAMRAEMEKMRNKALKEKNRKIMAAKKEKERKMLEEEKQRNLDFQKALKEKKQEDRMNALKRKENELRKIKEIKKNKKKDNAAIRAKKKADIKKQEKILASKKQQWALEKMEMKKLKREEELENKIDAKNCSTFVVHFLVFDVLDPLIDQSEEKARQERKNKVLYNKKMLKQAKNWEQNDDGSWLNWRSKETQWEVPECVQVMWEVTGTGPSANEWELLYDESGYAYYYNQTTGESTYDVPVGYDNSKEGEEYYEFGGEYYEGDYNDGNEGYENETYYDY
jgi:hypothetical protein